jgi:hypothetical protein
MKYLICVFAWLLMVSFARAETLRQHGAHVHGAARLGIAFEGALGEIDYDGAAVNIYGFEHKAVSAKDKKAQAEGLDKMEKHIAEMIQFDSDLKCQFTEAKASLEQDGDHSDVNGKFKVTCQRSPIGTTVKIDFSKFFPTLKKIDIQVLADSVQKSVKVEKFPTEFSIK